MIPYNLVTWWEKEYRFPICMECMSEGVIVSGKETCSSHEMEEVHLVDYSRVW
jgi:hypothetical protein